MLLSRSTWTIVLSYGGRRRAMLSRKTNSWSTVWAFHVSNTFGNSQKQTWATSHALPASSRVIGTRCRLVVFNGKGLAVEVGGGNLEPLDTAAHVASDRHRASGRHGRAMLLDQVAEFGHDSAGHLGLLGWLCRGIRVN